MASATTQVNRKTDEGNKSAAAKQAKSGPLSAEELRKMDAYWRGLQLLIGRPDLSARQSAPQGAAQAGAHQATALGRRGETRHGRRQRVDRVSVISYQ